MNKNKFLRKIWYGLSVNQRTAIRRMYYFPADFRDKLLGKTHKYVPPRGKIYTGSPSGADLYVKQSLHQLALLKNEIGLKPGDFVLDIGSGIGRTAISLTEYLDKTGIYEGFDVVKKGVDWCNRRIRKDFPNFNFTYIPLYNDLYSDTGNPADKFVFPYEDNYFDKIFSFSVFTHMTLEEIQNYFFQMHRVLKPDGQCFSTFFLYDNHNEQYIQNRPVFGFPVQKQGYKLMNENVVAGNIAIHKEQLESMLNKAGLQMVKVVDGFWKDEVRDSHKIEYQDIVVFKKNECN